MHNYVIPESVKERAIRRKGKLHAVEAIEAARTALVVVDMQNIFVGKGFPVEVPVARQIVPNINRMAAAIRAAGGRVIWIQTTATGALECWGNNYRYLLTSSNAAQRLAGFAEDSEGFRLYPELEALPGDIHVKKITYSAMVPDPSKMKQALAQYGLDTLLITGTATNVCCESTARDASMFNYRVIMLSDGNAAATDEEHAGTLNNFQIFFGDVMTADEAIARLAPAVARKTA